MLDYDDAIALIGAAAQALSAETVALGGAQGRVLAADVRAAIASPAGDASAMDGIAVRDADMAAGVPVRLIGTSFAGEPFAGALGPGEGVRIFTGALLPTGADRVIIQEHVRFEGDLAHVEAGYGPAWHVRRRGEDFAEGDLLVPAGTVLGPGPLLAVAGADVAEVSVVRRPRLRVLATGSELVPPGTARNHAAAIPDSVGPAVAALAREWGADVAECACLPDDLARLAGWARAAVADADVVVITGGASVGARDYAQAMFAGLPFTPVFAKARIKPGKPVWVARSGATWIVGLPGNPSSALVTGRLFLAPLLAALGGRGLAAAQRWRDVRVAGNLDAGGDREVFMMACAEGDSAAPAGRQQSGGQAVWARANCLLRSARCHQDAAGQWWAAAIDL